MSRDPEESNEETETLGGDQAVTVDADLFDVFDDDEDGGGCFSNIAMDYDALLFDGESIEELLAIALADNESKTVAITENAKPAAAALMKPKKKRQSLKIEQADRGLPPPRWHSEAADKPHRQAIQMEIEKLLQMRKTSPPSETWQKQLPHKVQKLEERLYRSAPSLEAYLDRRSLKERLKTVAKAITQQFKERKMKRASIQSSQSSDSSRSSFGNVANRDPIASIGSLDSLQTVHRMLTNKTVLPIPVASTSELESISQRQVLPQSPLLSFTQQPASSTVGDVRNSQTTANGNAQQQHVTDTQWQPPQELAAFPPGLQRSHSLPLQMSAFNSSHQAMGFPQNSHGNFVNPNNRLQAPMISNNNLDMLNQGVTLNNQSLFGQPMNMMMLNSANAVQMNSALSAMEQQQRQLQYALSTQQTQMMQQQQQQQQSRSGVLENTSFVLASAQPNSMPPNYFMPTVTTNGSMPPPPRLYQGDISSSEPTPVKSTSLSGAPSRKKGSSKKSKL